MNKQLPLLFLGAGGHAQVLLDIARLNNKSILGVCAPELAAENIEKWHGLDILGGDEAILRYSPENILLVNATGSLPGKPLHKRLYWEFVEKGYTFANLIHPSAIIGSNCNIASGVQIMAGCILQAGCSIAENVIINTRSSLDHGCTVKENSHIAPGAILCGDVYVKDDVHVGSGAIIIQGITLGSASVVAAGCIVPKDVPDFHKIGMNKPVITLGELY